MFEVEVHNFQSIRHARLGVDGFTAVLGKSNIGKSALVRAVQYALTNASGVSFVRHAVDCERVVRGRKKCKCSAKVCLRMPHMEVTWEKGDAINRYTVVKSGGPPETFDGLDRGTPPFLQREFPQMKIRDHKELVQIPDQFEPVFLLNCNGPAVADVLSDVARLDRVNVAASLASKDRREALAKKKVREADVLSLQDGLSAYRGLDLIDTPGLVEDLRGLESKQAQLSKVSIFLDRVRAAKDSYTGLLEVLKPALPVFDRLETDAQQLALAARLEAELTSIETSLEGLDRIAQHELPDEPRLRFLGQAYLQVEGFMQALTDKGPVIKKLLDLDRIEVPVDRVTELHKELATVQSLLSRYTGAQQPVDRFLGVEGLEVPDLEEVRKSLAELQKVQAWVSKLEALDLAMTETETSLSESCELEDSIVRELRGLGMCPTCDQPLGAEHHLHLETL